MKRKVITDQNTPLPKESPREFSELLKEYQAISGTGAGGSSLWKLVSAAAAVAIVVSIIAFWNTNTELKTSEQKTNQESHLSAPLDYEFTSFNSTISPAEEHIIVTPEGVIIEIPENAFTSPESSLNSDSIEISLTHYDDALAVLMSQIPMHYDSAGTKYHFQSDGMFQISALRNGQEVQLEKELTIHYPQTTGRSTSKNYFLAEHGWEYTGTSPLKSTEEICDETIYRFTNSSKPNSELETISSELASLNSKTTELKQQIASLKSNSPLEPKKQNFNNYRFYLDVDPAEFPELSSFEQVLFEVKDSRFNFSMFDQTWNDISVKKSSREGRYLVTLKSGRQVEIFDVYPVLEEEEFDTAFNEYSTELKNNREKQKTLEEVIAQNEAQEAEFLAELEIHKREIAQLSERKKSLKQLLSGLNPSSVFRSVNIGDLGVVNFDMALPLPAKGVSVPADFYVASTDAPIHQVSFIDVKDNIYYSFTRAEFPEFRFLKGKKYVLTSVLSDGTLVSYRGDFESENIKRGEPHRFKLELAPTNDLSELKLYLGLTEEEPA